MDTHNDLFVSDNQTFRIRQISLTGYTIDKPLPAGLVFDYTNGTISGTPTVTSPATDYTVTAYNSAGNSSTIVNIQVNDASTFAYSTPHTYTVGYTIQSLEPNPGIAGATYSTSGLPPGLSIDPQTGAISGVPNTVSPATNYTIIATAANGDKYTTIINITIIQSVNNPLVMQLFGPETTCNLNFNPIVSGGVGSYTYSSSNAAVAVINATTGLISIMGAGVSSISVSDNANEESVQVLTVTKANSNPTISITPDYYASCRGLSLTYTATVANTNGGYINYQWQVNGQNAGTNSIQFTSTTLQTGDKITCILPGNACFNQVTSNTATLEADPYVTPLVTITSSANGAIPYNTPVTFTAAVTNGGPTPSLMWLLNGTSTGIFGPSYSSSCLNDGDVVTCTLNVPSGACYTTLTANSNPIQVNVTGSYAQSVTITASSANILQGTSVSFTAKVYNAGFFTQYQWKINNISAGTNSSTFVSSTLNNNDIVTCTISNNSGCINTTGSNPITITVYTPIVFGPIPNKTTCDIDFDPDASGGTPPYIYTSSNSGVAVISGTNIHIVSAGSTQITVTDQNGQHESQSLTINEESTPIVTIAADNASVCAGTPVNFTATISNPGSVPFYQWEVNGNYTGTNSPQFTADNLSSTDVVQCIAFTPCSLSGFSNKISVNVNSFTNPSVTIAQSPLGPVVAGTKVTFTATTANAGASPIYQWQVNGNHVGPNSYQFTNSSLNNGNVVTCALITANVCVPAVTSNAIILTILPPSAITIPNTFTPNGDGKNDLWEITDLNYYPKCEVSVYSRYGTLVFQSKGYGKAWDGTYNGSALPSGTYYYIINLDNISPPRSGSVTIVR